MKSFADSDTHFEIITSETPVSVDGFALNEPTGEVRCCECGESHQNIDEIPHTEECTQRFVHSHFYVDATLDG